MGFLSRLFGGSQESKTSIPAWLEEAGQDVYGEAKRLQGVGFIPYRGPDVAAISPLQQAAMGSTAQMAGAFGMPAGQGGYLPKAQRSAGGVMGYSSAPGFDAAVRALKKSNPQQYAALLGMVSGEQNGNNQLAGQSGGGAEMSSRDALIAYMTGAPVDRRAARANVGNGDTANNARPSGGSIGGSLGNYSGLRDMVDGGGPGAAGQNGGALGLAGRVMDRGLIRALIGGR